ncbi:MAG: tetratricopeptide repeat protein [Planctomycetes bacterium]|nr:tetratricopeptide repeat protein [Planctomycetota bacterium]
MPTEAAPRSEPPIRARLREVVADCLERMELNGSKAIDETCVQHPDLAAQIRRRLGHLKDLGLSTTATSPWNVPKQLGDFDLGESIGAGGMGVVYHARQRSLSRDVALKVIRPDLQWMASSQSRFRREIDAVSRLQHPSIVQIHAVGEEQGVPYFAMEYLPGCTIAAVRASNATASRRADNDIDTRLRGRSWIDTCVYVAQQVAIALDHAHRRGVLHRDIKPQNIMVTPEGRVVVMDFGLAMTEGSKKLTRTGAEIGSLLWMAPEQVRGRHEDVHETTDIYGLGATLYEMLTLRPAFGTGSDEVIRQAILNGEFPAPRTLLPSLPWDVETVCLVAMEKDPGRRYASAAALVEDLDRLLHHRSIEARRPGLQLRVRRWAERHPALTVAMALMTLLTATSIVFAFQQRSANRATQAALENLKKQSERSNRNVKRARSAIDLMLTRFADKHLKDVPQFEQIRASLLEDALTLQQGLLSEEGDDPAVRRETADAYDRLSTIQQLLGNNEEGLVSIEKAIEIREELLPLEPDNKLHRDQIGLGHHDLGNVYRSLGRWDDSERHFRRSIALCEESIRRFPADSDGFTVTLVRSLNDLAITLEELTRLEEAVALCRKAFELIEPLAQQAPQNDGRLSQVAAALQTQGPALVRLGRYDEAIASLSAAVPWREKLVALMPNYLEHRRQLGLLHYQLSYALRLHGEAENASASVDESIEVQRKILADYPTALGVQWDLAQSLHERGMVMKERAEMEEALASLRDAIRWYEPLVAGAPDRPGFSHELGWTLSDLAACLLEQGDATEAEALVQRAITLQTACIAIGPKIEAYQERLLDHFRVLRDILLARNDRAAAIALADRAGAVAFADRLRPAVALFRAATLARCEEIERATRVLEEASIAAIAGTNATAPAPGSLHANPDFDELRARPEFAELLAHWLRR